MTFTVRSRHRDSRVNVSGTLYRRYVGTLQRNVNVGSESWCDDTVGNLKGDNPLVIKQHRTSCWLMNGRDVDAQGELITEFKDCPVSYTPGPSSTLGKYPVPTNGELGALALKVCAWTNPSKPEVSIPTFLGELREVPDMYRQLPELLRRAGLLLRRLRYGGVNAKEVKTLLGVTSEANLADRFGWRPFVSDFVKLCRHARSVNNRLAMLYRLNKDRCLRRALELTTPDPIIVTQPQVVVQSDGGWVMAERIVTYNMKLWASAKWEISPMLPWPFEQGSQNGFEAFHRKAVQLAYGITCYEAFATAWELLPWSWLVDWFLPVGDFFAANNNSLPLVCSSVCIMRTLTSKSSYLVLPAPLTSPWIRLTGSQEEGETRKERYVVPTPTVSGLYPRLPVLTAGQWSILGSLAVTRFKGARRLIGSGS